MTVQTKRCENQIPLYELQETLAAYKFMPIKLGIQYVSEDFSRKHITNEQT